MMNSFQHNLGSKALDEVSGFKGIIVSRVTYLFGCTQYGLAPKKTKDDSIRKTEYFDEGRLKIVGKGTPPVDGIINDFDLIFKHAAGKEAQDKVTGFKGIIIGRVEYLHSSSQYVLSPKVGEDGKTGDSEQFDEGRLIILSDGVNPEEVQGVKRGGINRDAPSV